MVQVLGLRVCRVQGLRFGGRKYTVKTKQLEHGNRMSLLLLIPPSFCIWGYCTFCSYFIIPAFATVMSIGVNGFGLFSF